MTRRWHEGIYKKYNLAILQKTVRVNTVQLIMTLVQSEDIIVRERYDEDLIRGQQFVLSFAAVIMLYMIGVKPEFLKERQVFVPESMRNEYKEVYAQNMMRVCQDIIREEYEVLNPVWRNYFSLCVKYKCGLETK